LDVGGILIPVTDNPDRLGQGVRGIPCNLLDRDNR
jgi:hypothetical protein